MKLWGSIAARSVAVLLLLPACLAGAKSGDKKQEKPPPVPAVRVLLENLGYRGTPTPGLLETRASMITLDFMDSDHLVFTYASRPLMQRDAKPEDPVARTDRMVHAEIVTLPDGKLEAQSDWRLHDRDPYVWPLDDGSFLLRVGGNLSLVDKELKTTKVMEMQGPIRWVQADKGCNLLVVEVEREQHSREVHEKLAHDAALFNAPPPAEDYETYGLRLKTGQDAARELFHVHLLQPGALTGTDEWLLQVGGGSGGKFDITALPLSHGGEKHLVLNVKSECRPSVLMLRHDVALVGVCTSHGGVEYGVTVEGKVLWKVKVEQPVWPYYERAADGSRFAVQRLVARHVHGAGGVAEDNLNAGMVEVYDVTTGARVFETALEPLYSTSHAVALSPNGTRLAVLRHGAVEVYDLPASKDADSTRAASTNAGSEKPVSTEPASKDTAGK